MKAFVSTAGSKHSYLHDNTGLSAVLTAYFN